MKAIVRKLSTTALIALACTATAQEHKITLGQLPAAVQATVSRESRGATIKGFSTEREHGKRVYEVETLVNGHTRDLQVATDGTLTEVEEEVALSALPASVRDALQKYAKEAQISKVESLTKRGILVAYEATIQKHGRKSEIQIGADGRRLAHEE